MISPVVIAVASVALAAVAGAQARGVDARAAQVTHYGIEDGLAGNSVLSITQDATGFIWVATLRGLQRFDGHAFEHVSAVVPGAPLALEGPIVQVHARRDSSLWAATSNTLYRQARRGARFEAIRLPSLFHRMVEDSAGTLWVLVAGGVGRIESRTASPTWLRPPVISSSACASIAASRRPVLLLSCTVGDSSALVEWDPRSGGERTIPLAAGDAVGAIREDDRGDIWVALSHGIVVVERRGEATTSSRLLGESVVNDLSRGQDGAMLVLTSTELLRVARARDRFDVRPAFAARGSFSLGLMARTMFIDREGGHWIGSITAGVYRVDPSIGAFVDASEWRALPMPFASTFVLALHRRSNGDLWVGTLRDGAYRVRSNPDTVERFVPDDGVRSAGQPSPVWGFLEDRRGRMWAVTERGICLERVPTFECHAPPGGEPGGSMAVRMPDGWFWIARTLFGVIAFDPETRTFGDTVTTLSRAVALHAESGSDELWVVENAIVPLRVREGRVTSRGAPIPAAVNSTYPIYQIHRDRAGVRWAASSQGLQRWNEAVRGFTLVDDPMLREVAVFSIAEDDEGMLWLGTTHGIVSYSASRSTVRRYGRRDGVGNGEFNRRAALRTPSGEMVFGGVEGATRFRPDVVVRRRAAPPVVFTRRRVVTAAGVRDSTLDGVETLHVGPDVRALTIDFAALGFAEGPSHRYRYRLEGGGGTWVETGERSVSFSALPPGRLTLRVQVDASTDGRWHEPGGTLDLEVIPPVWKRGSFRLALAALVALALWMLHRYRLQQAVATERLRLRISRDLHDEIGAGLSSIALLSDAARRNAELSVVGQVRGGASDPAPELPGGANGDQLQRIGSAARQMVDHLRDIVWAIDPDGDRVEDLSQRMRDVADDLLAGIRVRFAAPSRGALVERVGMEARRDLLLIYKELLHNVARHSGAGEVEISLVLDGDALRLRVSDDGHGFDPESVRRGTGLKSMGERTERLGGRLTLSPRPGGGTVATLMLPRR